MRTVYASSSILRKQESQVPRRRSRTVVVLLVLLSTGLIGSASGSNGSTSAEADGFRLAEPGYVYSFPRDHAAHNAFRTEWWYYTGHLQSPNGRRFGFQVTFFRRAVGLDAVETLPSRWSIRQLYLAHIAISDLDGRRFRYADRLSREGLGKAGAREDRLRVWIDRWSVEAEADDPSTQLLRAAQDGMAIELKVRPLKPPVIHGRHGVSRKGQDVGQASHYYSFTRMDTAGRLTIDGETFEVTGTSWMDHEFGSADLSPDLVGWDWFSLQFRDGSELMIYQLRRADGSFDRASSGTMVYPDGRSEFLTADDLRVIVREHWTSPVSGARYPAAWTVFCPSLQIQVDVTPLMADQELATRRSTQVTYWEGAVDVSGTIRERPASGQGYVELTGYAERFSERL